MSACPYDSSAGAFYILDYGKTTVNSSLSVFFEQRVRLKILDKSEFDRADVSITSWGGAAKKLKAFTYNMVNGQLVTTKLEKENIYKERVDSDRTKLSFSLPDVREGSVIEYSYEVEYGDVRNLNTWYFQTSVPVMKSEYKAIFPQNFHYYRTMTGYYGLDRADVKESSGNMHHHYVATNLPAYESEDFIRSRDYTISKIGFKLQAVNLPGYIKNYLYNSYGELSNKQYKTNYWSREINKAPWAAEALAQLKSDDKLAYATKIFDYVKSFDHSKTSMITLKSCFKEKRGTDRDKTRTLIALLNEAGLAADPVLIRTRRLGPIDPYFPMMSHFNFAIARLKIDDKSYLMDPTEKDHLFGVLPGYCINGQGLVIGEGPEKWVALNPYRVNIETVTADLTLSDDGLLDGKVTIYKKGYKAWRFKDRLLEDGEDQYIKNFEGRQENWFITEHNIDNEDDYFVKEQIEVEIEDQTEDLGNVIYLNPFVYSVWQDHPFKAEERTYPIDFGVPFTENTTSQIEIPANYTVESLPETTAIGLPNKSGVFTYSASIVDNKILISQRMMLRNAEFLPTDYKLIKEFFTQIIEKAGEQIVLKRT